MRLTQKRQLLMHFLLGTTTLRLWIFKKNASLPGCALSCGFPFIIPHGFYVAHKPVDAGAYVTAILSRYFILS